MDDSEFDDHTLQLAPGDRVYFYSDGVPEAMNSELDPFSDEKMLGLMRQSSDKPLASAIVDLFEAVRAWCQPKGPKDDVSILGCEIE